MTAGQASKLETQGAAAAAFRLHESLLPERKSFFFFFFYPGLQLIGQGAPTVTQFIF